MLQSFIIAALCLNLSPVDREAPVRISLFGLFKPEIVSPSV